MTQFSFEFDPPKPTEPPAAAPVAAPESLDLEQMARLLEQHADYRVLRRLVPCMDFGPHPGQPGAVLRVLVLDTETTGLSHQTDKVIELAMLLVQVDADTGLPWGPVEVFEGFEDPGMPIPTVAQEVTGISDDMVKGQRLDDEQVAAMVSRADLIVAHNAGFDRPFVEARFPCFAARSWACSFMDIDWKAAGSGSSRLSALANDQGWFYDAHRAQVDCHALLQVLSQPVGPGATTGLSQLITAASLPSFKLRATGSPFESKDKLKARGYRWDADAKVWYCTLASQTLLDAELAWLKAEVYGRRSARLDIEAMDSTVRYSARPGRTVEQGL
jgi:DNA polymerase-3 subunit epsilon